MITKKIGVASPLLLNAHQNSELFDEIVIEIVGHTPSGARETVVERIMLTNAYIKSVRQRIGDGTESGCNKLLEVYGLSFQKIALEAPRWRSPRRSLSCAAPTGPRSADPLRILPILPSNPVPRFASPSKLVAAREAEYPRPKRRLCDDELIGADERAGVGIAEVLPECGHDPSILCDTD